MQLCKYVLGKNVFPPEGIALPAAEAAARATMTSKVPALFGAVGHVVAV